MALPRVSRPSFIDLLTILVAIGTVGAATIPHLGVRYRQTLEAEMAAVTANVALAQARHERETGRYLTGGPCTALPELALPPGLRCVLHPRPAGGFLVVVDHPGSAAGCAWDSTASPNLVCS